MCSPPNIKVIKGSKMEVVGHVAWRWELGKEYNMVVEKSEGRRPIWEPKYKWKVSINRNSVCKVVCWIQLAQDEDKWRAVMKTFMGLLVL
jgi:hypothetical protein